MAEPQASTPEATPPQEPQVPATGQAEVVEKQETPALTVEAIREALMPELKRDLKAAYDAARRAEAKAEAANKKASDNVASLEVALEAAATVGMDEKDRELWKARRALERQTQSRTVPEPDVESQRQEFMSESLSILEELGIPANDPEFRQLWEEHVSSQGTFAQGRRGLTKAIDLYRKGEVKKAAAGVTEREQKAREDERAKLRNETRVSEGKVDKGAPTGAVKRDWLAMPDKDFDAIEVQREAERRQRRITGYSK